jgi:hypothetical protein
VVATCTFQKIACGQTIQGSLAAGDCTSGNGNSVDYYQFDGNAGDVVSGTLSASVFTPDLELVDPSSATFAHSSAAGTTGLQARLDASGLWTWNVSNAGSALVSGAYTFSLQCTPAAAACTADDGTLCLGASSRFKVIASYDAGGGNAGASHAVGLTSDTGYLWFFAAANVEAIVKVVDGCGLNGNYWVFAGGLTNVAVTITVTDTTTNTTKTYRNPAQTAFQPIQDTSAFASCP